MSEQASKKKVDKTEFMLTVGILKTDTDSCKNMLKDIVEKASPILLIHSIKFACSENEADTISDTNIKEVLTRSSVHEQLIEIRRSIDESKAMTKIIINSIDNREDNGEGKAIEKATSIVDIAHESTGIEHAIQKVIQDIVGFEETISELRKVLLPFSVECDAKASVDSSLKGEKYSPVRQALDTALTNIRTRHIDLTEILNQLDFYEKAIPDNTPIPRGKGPEGAKIC